MQKIIIHIDPNSIYYSVVIKYGLKVAQNFGAQLNFYYVKENHSKYVEEEEQEKTLEKLNEAVYSHLGKQHVGLKVKTAVVFGDRRLELNRLTRKLKPDLLIMGTHKNNALLKLLYKDEAVSIAHEVSCPVLLIPPNKTSTSTNRIIYTSELIGTELYSLQQIKDWASTFNTEVICLHPSEESKPTEQEKRMENQLQEFFGKTHFHFVGFDADELEKIHELVDFNEGDLLIAIYHRRKWWAEMLKPSSSVELAKHATIPMLIIK